jgi:hypothetical protein
MCEQVFYSAGDYQGWWALSADFQFLEINVYL